MSKQKLTATLPDGTLATRTTEYEYQFVIAALQETGRSHKAEPGEPGAVCRSYGRGRHRQSFWLRWEGTGDFRWVPHAWSSRRDLAEKEAAKWRGVTGCKEVRIIPVNGTI